MLNEAFKQGIALGRKYGLVKGIRMWTDQSGNGAIGVIVIFAGVLITLYLSAMILGSMSATTTTGLAMSSRWNTTVTAIDTSSASAFSLSNVLPLAVIGTGVMGVVIGVLGGTGQ